MDNWSEGTDWEKRANAAGLCKPSLLTDKKQATRALSILDKISGSMERLSAAESDYFSALRKGLGYRWSVSVVAYPEQETVMMNRWLQSDNKDILWVIKANL